MCWKCLLQINWYNMNTGVILYPSDILSMSVSSLVLVLTASAKQRCNSFAFVPSLFSISLLGLLILHCSLSHVYRCQLKEIWTQYCIADKKSSCIYLHLQCVIYFFITELDVALIKSFHIQIGPKVYSFGIQNSTVVGCILWNGSNMIMYTS